MNKRGDTRALSWYYVYCFDMLDRSRHSTTPYPHNINIKHQPISFQFQPSNLYIHRVHKRAWACIYCKSKVIRFLLIIIIIIIIEEYIENTCSPNLQWNVLLISSRTSLPPDERNVGYKSMKSINFTFFLKRVTIVCICTKDEYLQIDYSRRGFKIYQFIRYVIMNIIILRR